MDWESYATGLEQIIERVNLNVEQRILVDHLVKRAKEKASDDNPVTQSDQDK